MGWGPGAYLLVRGAGSPPTGTHTLQLARTQPSDSGMYMCEALNAAGRDQKLVQLSVLGTSCLSPTPSVSPRPHTLRQHSQERGQLAPGGAWDALHPLWAAGWVTSWPVELDTLRLRPTCALRCSVIWGRSRSPSEPQASRL